MKTESRTKWHSQRRRTNAQRRKERIWRKLHRLRILGMLRLQLLLNGSPKIMEAAAIRRRRTSAQMASISAALRKPCQPCATSPATVHRGSKVASGSGCVSKSVGAHSGAPSPATGIATKRSHPTSVISRRRPRSTRDSCPSRQKGRAHPPGGRRDSSQKLRCVALSTLEARNQKSRALRPSEGFGKNRV